MKITDKQKIRGSQYVLSFDTDDDFTVTVDAATFDESYFFVGRDISADELEALLALSRKNRTRSRALYYLSGRDYAAKELERKLSRSVDRETAAAVVERLEEVGLVNDSAYAERMARSYANYRLYPRRRIMAALREKGVSREDAENAVEQLETDDLQVALALLRKKYYNKLQTDEDRKKVAAALARSGFGFDTVKKAMEMLATEET
ncbi:MAG: regulatory protein RecX [Clostridia bacterium]|nr:regulatory protein RecX [Clostridia bacterium]